MDTLVTIASLITALILVVVGIMAVNKFILKGGQSKQQPNSNVPHKDVRELIEALLKDTSTQPHEKDLRVLINKVFSEIFILRHQGYSYEQIADIFRSVGISISVGNLRDHYTEVMSNKMKEINERFEAATGISGSHTTNVH